MRYKNAIKEAACNSDTVFSDALYDRLCKKDTVGFWKNNAQLGFIYFITMIIKADEQLYVTMLSLLSTRPIGNKIEIRWKYRDEKRRLEEMKEYVNCRHKPRHDTEIHINVHKYTLKITKSVFAKVVLHMPRNC